MLKHVQSTLSRRQASKEQLNREHQRPPSPAPSTISSCSSISSLGSIFFSSSSSSGSPNSEASSSNSNSSNLSVLSGSTTASGSSGYSSSTPVIHGHSHSHSHSLSQSSGIGLTGHHHQRRNSLCLSIEEQQQPPNSWSRMRRRSRTSLAESSRAGSRLSINSSCSNDQGQGSNLVPLRIYAACLRPDIQYKTVGVNQSTTCSQVIHSLLNKCKLRYKDPKLFILTMELKIRNSNGEDIEASIPLEDCTNPLQLFECYPRGQAKFSLKLNAAESKLVKVYDETGLLGWQYKSIMISEKTTAAELIDILFRFAPNLPALPANNNNLNSTICFMLFLEVNGNSNSNSNWSQRLEPKDMVIPMQSIVTNQFSESTTNNGSSGNSVNVKLVLRTNQQQNLQQYSSSSPSSPFLHFHNRLSQPIHQSLSSFNDNGSIISGNSNRNSVLSLYENVSTSTNSISNNSNNHSHSHSHLLLCQGQDKYESCTAKTSTSTTNLPNTNTTGREYWKRRRSQSLSSSSGDSSSLQSGSACPSKESTRFTTNHESELLDSFSTFNLTNNKSSSSKMLNDNGRNNRLYSTSSMHSKYEFFV